MVTRFDHRTIGCVLGMSTVLVTLLAMSVGGREDLLSIVGPVLFLLGLPFGALFGALLGTTTRELEHLSRPSRCLIYVAITQLVLLLGLPFQPELAVHAVPVALVHALVFSYLTERPRRELPVARVVRR